LKQIPLDRIRPEVRAVEGYHLRPIECPVKLNQNESPFDIPDEMKSRILEEVRSQPWSRYPQSMEPDLVGRLAANVGWAPEGLIVANGSNTLVQLVLAVTTSPNVSVAIPSPSFSLYGLYAGMFGARVVQVPMTDVLAYDVDGLRRAIDRENAHTVVICSPNNPTGGRIDNRDLEQLLEGSDALFLVDEAYGEFSTSSALDLLPDYGNLVILKTFSKALGAAGIRIGYLIGHPPIVEQILKAKIPFDINVFSRTAAMHILESPELIDGRVAAILSERDRMFEALRDMDGVSPHDTHANFILFAVDDPAATFASLVDSGVLVRDVTSYPMLEKALRVSVGTPQENDRFLEALARAMPQVGAAPN
jgi:histidinol-phosphate aminotransferase